MIHKICQSEKKKNRKTRLHFLKFQAAGALKRVG